MILVLLLAAGFQQINSLVAVRFNRSTTISSEEQTIRILSWNVSRWDERNKKKRGGVSYRPLMLDYIKLQNADILCVQEFFECLAPEYFQENIPEFRKMGYPYVYFTPSSYLFNNKFQYGLCILSRYPIVDSGFTNPFPGVHSEGVSFADISVNGSVIRVFNAHLESPGLTKSDYNTDGTAKVAVSTLSKIKSPYEKRYKQAEHLHTLINESPHPSVVCLDMNDVPASNIYYNIKGELQDAFLKKGAGLGRTYRYLSPFMRIDYVFTDNRLLLHQVETGNCIYSDHYPILVSLSPQKP